MPSLLILTKDFTILSVPQPILMPFQKYMILKNFLWRQKLIHLYLENKAANFIEES